MEAMSALAHFNAPRFANAQETDLARQTASATTDFQPLEITGANVLKEDYTVVQNGPPKRRLAQAVSNINDFLQQVHRELHFSVNEDTGRTVIQVVDQSTQEVIRQIPAESVLRLAADLEELSGLLLRERV